ncbi:variable surface protein [Plasmodium gonderi]|uniref:Variable surface protein n=1 Tax=Plasmodium gonderi TaxID=77519 RepID=A0A1Y1JSP1_PLAGO|nr:variable surface protein [Plasmodium gonderi]GAW84458.1 variable surface protein [Plasmodium gonderi]
MSAEFNFMNIFPTCSDDYNNHARNRSLENSSELVNPCTAITILSNFRENRESFMPKCTELIIYLDYIYSKATPSYTTRCCKYFNYKLKQILKSNEHSTQNTNVAYSSMIRNTDSEIYKKVQDICKNHVDDLDESTFKILETLDNLYDMLKKENNKCTSNSECYEKYMELSRKHNGVDNHSLYELLSNFKKDYIENREHIDKGNMIQVTSKVETPVVSHHASRINPRTIILVFFIILLTTLMITFFLYKYTSYVSSLHPITSIIKRMWKRKNKKYIKLLNSFENDNEELINKSSQIPYNPLRYF